MAVFDASNKTVTIKLVYYGCALGGKTTNLVTLHRLTDPDGRQGLVSIATTNDRTLFFDLLPMDLGQVGGLAVKVKLYTVPGQIHYELTRRQVLAGADGVVLVVDSSPEAAEWNVWTFKNLRENLENNHLDPDETPTVVQWNKRDLPHARAVEDLHKDLNVRGLPEFEAVATAGVGVVETFAEVLKAAIVKTYAKTGRPVKDRDQLGQIVDKALEQARKRIPDEEPDRSPTFDKRFDWDAYREEQEDLGHDRRVVDQSSLLSESVATSMMLAERLESLKSMERLSKRRGHMMNALSRLAPMLADPKSKVLPPGVTALLLEGAQRKRGSLLLYLPGDKIMDVREAVPDGTDALNDTTSDAVGSVAQLLCERSEGVSVIDDIVTELFFGQAPSSVDGVASLLVASLDCDGIAFGALLIYGRVSEARFDDTEREYWKTAGVLVGLSLHWRGLLRKVSRAA